MVIKLVDDLAFNFYVVVDCGQKVVGFYVEIVSAFLYDKKVQIFQMQSVYDLAFYLYLLAVIPFAVFCDGGNRDCTRT